MPDVRDLERSDLVTVLRDERRLDVEFGDEPAVVAVRHGDLEVAVLVVGLHPLEVTLPAEVVHALGRLLGEGDFEVTRLLHVAGVCHLVRHVLERPQVGVPLVSGDRELVLVDLVARPLVRLLTHAPRVGRNLTKRSASSSKGPRGRSEPANGTETVDSKRASVGGGSETAGRALRRTRVR